MKWALRILAMVAMPFFAFVAHSADGLDMDDPDSCWAPFGTNMNGYLLDAEGKNKIAEVVIRETRGTNTGSSFLKMTVTPTGSKSSIILTKDSVRLPDRATLTSSDGAYRADAVCNVKLVGSNYSGIIHGTLTGGKYAKCQFRVASSDVDIDAKVPFNPDLDFKGYWGIAFIPSEANGQGADVVKNGFTVASIYVNKGKVKTTIYTPSGMRLTSTAKYTTEGESTVVPVSFNRTYNGSKETLSFKLVWNNEYVDEGLSLEDALSVQDVSLWKADDAKAKIPFTVQPLCIGSGLPYWTGNTFKAAKKIITLPEGAVQAKAEKLSYKPATGIFSGSVKIVPPNGKKAVNMVIYGIEIGGKGYGFGFVKNTLSAWVLVTD